MVEPHSSNVRVITTNFLGVRIFRKFTGDDKSLMQSGRSEKKKDLSCIFLDLCHAFGPKDVIGVCI